MTHAKAITNVPESKVNLKKAVDNSLDEVLTYEFSRREIEQIKTVSEVILAVIAVAGVVTLGAIIPGALKGILWATGVRKKFKGLAREAKQKKIERAFYYLRNSGL